MPTIHRWSYGIVLYEIFTIGRLFDIFTIQCPGARFSKLPVITGPVELFCFPFQVGVSKLLKVIQ